MAFQAINSKIVQSIWTVMDAEWVLVGIRQSGWSRYGAFKSFKVQSLKSF